MNKFKSDFFFKKGIQWIQEGRNQHFYPVYHQARKKKKTVTPPISAGERRDVLFSDFTPGKRRFILNRCEKIKPNIFKVFLVAYDIIWFHIFYPGKTCIFKTVKPRSMCVLICDKLHINTGQNCEICAWLLGDNLGKKCSLWVGNGMKGRELSSATIWGCHFWGWPSFVLGFPGMIPAGCRTRIALVIKKKKNRLMDPSSHSITQGTSF